MAIQRFWLKCIIVLLAGYFLADRGFAHLGIPPIFVGDIVMVFGIFAIVLYGGLYTVIKTRFGCAFLAFASWSVIRTLPYLQHYRTDALRDAALYVYGTFALLLSGMLLRNPDWFSKLPVIYYRFIRWALLLLPVFLLVRYESRATIPTFLTGGIPLIYIKLGDLGCHLGGAAAFWTLGLQFGNEQKEAKLSPRNTAMIAGWLLCFLFVLAGNRGGLLSSVTVIGIALLFSRQLQWKRSAFILVSSSVLAVAFLGMTSISIKVGGTRAVSFDKLSANLVSLIGQGDSAEDNQKNTMEWRLAWWTKIVHYTTNGPYYNGKGYGINLASDDGFQVDQSGDDALRSPHNSTMTVLARSGLLGLVLWLQLVGIFILSMIRSINLAKRLGYIWWSRVCIWIFAYWCGFMLNSCFDPVIESPQGGIWFWSLIGFGIAAGLQLRREADQVAFRPHHEAEIRASQPITAYFQSLRAR